MTKANVHSVPMKRQLTISNDPIDESALLEGRTVFRPDGRRRLFSRPRSRQRNETTINAIEYEAFHKMAEHQFNLLFDEMEKRWPIESVRLVHRLGTVRVNEPSLWVEVVAPHRGEAFAACQWLIDRMKEVVPIWKKPPLTWNLKLAVRPSPVAAESNEPVLFVQNLEPGTLN